MKLLIKPLNQTHDRESFKSGKIVLDNYIKNYAKQDIKRNISRTFVVSFEDSPKKIIGYYSLSANSLEPALLPEQQIKKLPKNPLHVSLLGKLAVDQKFQSQGLGKILLIDALIKIYVASQTIAVYAVIVDALNEDARIYYEKYGFISLPNNPLKLFLPLSTIESLVD